MPHNYRSRDREKFAELRVTSRYLHMRDGTRLAVDVYFPQPLPTTERLPAIIHQTRYWRRPALRPPFNWFIDLFSLGEAKLIKELVLSGYAFVNVDARGSGASFGSRKHPWTPDEVQDGVEVVDWVLRQEWSSGEVGSVGFSYTGTSAEFLQTKAHPAVKAVMPLFSLYDIYEDIAFPGGIRHHGFLSRWGAANDQLDRNVLPPLNKLAKLMVKGVAPVRGDEAYLAPALSDHRANRSVDETSVGIEYRDQSPPSRIVHSMDDFSPHHFVEAANAARHTAVFSGSGWFDGAYPNAAIKRFLNLDLPYNRLILGPWNHGGKWHITPGKSGPVKDDLAGIATAYFDHFLKGYATPAAHPPRVEFYTMQAERWQEADQWPPADVVEAPLYLHQTGRLENQANEVYHEVELQHRRDTGTGDDTRWRSLMNMVPSHTYYPDRAQRTRDLLHFDTTPLKKALEVTGHPRLELWVNTHEPDGEFFVYLDEVRPNGEVLYVTEGMLRAQHSEVGMEQAEYRTAGTPRTFRRADVRPLRADAPNLVRIDLLPTSYEFRAGSRIRVSLATADVDHFDVMAGEGQLYRIGIGGNFASRIVLPVR